MALLYHRPMAGAKRSADGEIGADSGSPDDERRGSDSAEPLISSLLHKSAGSAQNANSLRACPVFYLIIVGVDEEKMKKRRTNDDDSFIEVNCPLPTFVL
ncbi:MAG: hypothetical protein QHJ81_08580 [Anaerolineae bacterium]|nr:hypothetical protein [Anaerolineae bacterium]